MHILSFFAFSLFPFVSAQVSSTSKFTNAWLADYVVGLTYQISWTAGNDRPVSLTISNSTWSLDLACKFETSTRKAWWPLTRVSLAFLPPQTTASFNWTVPSSLSYLSSYALSLSQNGPSSDVSPAFSIVDPASSQTPPRPQPTSQNATTAMNGTILALTPGSTGTGVNGATSTYWDTRCSCMKTAVAPAPTSLPGSFNYTPPPMTTGSPVPTLSPYLVSPHGRAGRLHIFSGRLGFVELGYALAMATFIVR
jgi:hypothetical protein